MNPRQTLSPQIKRPTPRVHIKHAAFLINKIRLKVNCKKIAVIRLILSEQIICQGRSSQVPPSGRALCDFSPS